MMSVTKHTATPCFHQEKNSTRCSDSKSRIKSLISSATVSSMLYEWEVPIAFNPNIQRYQITDNTIRADWCMWHKDEAALRWVSVRGTRFRVTCAVVSSFGSGVIVLVLHFFIRTHYKNKTFYSISSPSLAGRGVCAPSSEI